MDFSRGDALHERFRSLVPGASHTYSKGEDQFPLRSPKLIARAEGAYCWDADGNRFVDWAMGNRVMILGHGNPVVNDAVKRQIDQGLNFTRPGVLEAEVAEFLVDFFPVAEMVKFGKNGSDVTSAAVKLARAATGRKIIACCGDHPFFSVGDWFIGTTPMASGVPAEVAALSVKFPYNDLAAVERLFAEHPGQVAGLDPRDGQERGAQARLPRGSARARRPRGCGADLRRDDRGTALRPTRRAPQVRRLSGPRDVREGDRQRLLVLAARRAPRHHGARRPRARPRAGVPAVADPQLGDGRSGCLPRDARGVRARRRHEPRLGCRRRARRRRSRGWQPKRVSRSSFASSASTATRRSCARTGDGTYWPALHTSFHEAVIGEGVLIPWTSVTYAHGEGELALTFDAVRDGHAARCGRPSTPGMSTAHSRASRCARCSAATTAACRARAGGWTPARHSSPAARIRHRNEVRAGGLRIDG